MTALARLLVALFSLGVCVQAGLAQGRPQAKKPEYKDVTIDGTVESYQGGYLKLKLTAGHPYTVMIVPQSKLGLSGTAKPDFLKPGMLVSFNVLLLDEKDKKVELESPPTELRIISPSESNVVGLFEDKEKEGLYYVCAKVSSFKEGKLTVGAAGKTITVPVPADMDIKVESSDPAFIRPGDTVKVMGKEVRAYKADGNNILEGQVVGQTVDVKLQDTLSSATFKKKK